MRESGARVLVTQPDRCLASRPARRKISQESVWSEFPRLFGQGLGVSSPGALPTGLRAQTLHPDCRNFSAVPRLQ